VRSLLSRNGLAIGIAVVVVVIAVVAVALAGTKPRTSDPSGASHSTHVTTPATQTAKVPDVGLTPQQVRKAYNLGPLLSRGSTVRARPS
jgi:hypothetical protein